jgi:hypothetical protein
LYLCAADQLFNHHHTPDQNCTFCQSQGCLEGHLFTKTKMVLKYDNCNATPHAQYVYTYQTSSNFHQVLSSLDLHPLLHAVQVSLCPFPIPGLYGSCAPRSLALWLCGPGCLFLLYACSCLSAFRSLCCLLDLPVWFWLWSPWLVKWCSIIPTGMFNEFCEQGLCFWLLSSLAFVSFLSQAARHCCLLPGQ